ncbi:hypothetical protein CapIbe_021588 [Capra ibex]
MKNQSRKQFRNKIPLYKVDSLSSEPPGKLHIKIIWFPKIGWKCHFSQEINDKSVSWKRRSLHICFRLASGTLAYSQEGKRHHCEDQTATVSGPSALGGAPASCRAGLLKSTPWNGFPPSLTRCHHSLICAWRDNITELSNQSILKEISPEYSLKGLILKLKLQYFGQLIRRTDSLEKTLMLGKIEGQFC